MDREREDIISFMGGASRLKASLNPARSTFDHWGEPQEELIKTVQDRVNLLASHMTCQWREHEQAIRNTGHIFDRLLADMEMVCGHFQQSFEGRNVPLSRIYSRVDADRSVGILNLLWHTVSFTARGNTKPMAMFRFGREPVFTGRIVALMGDFQELAANPWSSEFSELLTHEVTSLYVPADPETPAVMSIKHLGDEEHYLNQSEAPRQFLLKTIEMVCAGGYFHEKEYY